MANCTDPKAIQDATGSDHIQKPETLHPVHGDLHHSGWLAKFAMHMHTRRGSVGFSSDSMSGVVNYAIMDEDSSDSPGMIQADAGIVIPKSSVINLKRSIFDESANPMGMSPNTHEHEAHSITQGFANPGAIGTNAGEPKSFDRGKFMAISEEGTISFDNITTKEIAQFEAYQNRTKLNNLSDKVADSMPMGDFPVATKESLAQLKEMKRRISESKRAALRRDRKHSETVLEEHFDMEIDKEGEEEFRSRKDSTSSQMSQIEEKPPSRLATFLLQKGFAQNWFFKNNDEADGGEGEGEGAESMTPSTAGTPEMEPDNPTFGNLAHFTPGVTESTPVGKVGKKVKTADMAKMSGFFPGQNSGTSRQEIHRMKTNRETNFFAPQNF